ncbi:MAG: DUF305 domain-containing protein [Parvibaculaceae bacterium]|nr:DUF305 domain-containing protein [Parvibaculaceae bacterium]
MSYLRFGAMILVSGIVMYAVMYLHTYELAHVRFSQTRLWMTILMVSAMALVMLAFMRSMYPSGRANAAIFVGAALVFAAALWFLRSQQTVDDVAYMKAMVPHHSIAVLTSRRAQIEDPRVRDLADSIVETQLSEIALMNRLIADLERNPPMEGVREAPPGETAR